MRFLLIFGKKTVPEWKECYYDYVNIKSLIILCKKAYAIRCNIEDLSRYDNYHLDENQTLIRYK